jgi:steroid 5-alpha reductase family enzyme
MDYLMDIAGIIQMAVAPAFLLTGIGAILSVMANRLSRIVDRFRILNEGSPNISDKEVELNYLLLRSKWTHWAIALTTLSALLVCTLIASIFISSEIFSNMDQLITLLFILAMISLIIGLVCFLAEVHLSKNVIKLNKT